MHCSRRLWLVGSWSLRLRPDPAGMFCVIAGCRYFLLTYLAVRALLEIVVVKVALEVFTVEH